MDYDLWDMFETATIKDQLMVQMVIRIGKVSTWTEVRAAHTAKPLTAVCPQRTEKDLEEAINKTGMLYKGAYVPPQKDYEQQWKYIRVWLPKGSGPPANVVSALKVTVSKFTIDTDAAEMASMSSAKKKEKKESVYGSALMNLINAPNVNLAGESSKHHPQLTPHPNPDPTTEPQLTHMTTQCHTTPNMLTQCATAGKLVLAFRIPRIEGSPR